MRVYVTDVCGKSLRSVIAYLCRKEAGGLYYVFLRNRHSDFKALKVTSHYIARKNTLERLEPGGVDYLTGVVYYNIKVIEVE